VPTITAQLDAAFRTAIQAAFGMDADPLIGPSQNDKFGDYQSNAAMGLAKQVSEKTGQKTNPRQVAEQIVEMLDLADIATEKPTIAGPGFINVKLSPTWLAGVATAQATDERLGIPLAAAQSKVVVDYSGPNIAKEMLVHHLRSTVIGDAFVRVLSATGNDVIRQNHIGDWGLQMGMVTFALEQSGAAAESFTLADLAQLYKKISKDSDEPTVRRQMAERTSVLQNTPKDQLHAWRRVRELTLTAAQQVYGRLGVLLTPDDVRGESDYSDDYAPMVESLIAEGQARESDGAIGIFPPGFVNRDGEPRPFIVRSRDGSFQYPTYDLAALRYRVTALRATRVIYTHDTRQAEHFAMLFAVAKALGWDNVDGQQARFEYAPFGAVLGEDGKPFKTRKGESVKLEDLLDEAEERAMAIVEQKNPSLPDEQKKAIAKAIGIGAVKYSDLSKDRVSDYVFSWDKMLAMEGNTAPYLQYVYARIRSIFRKAGVTAAIDPSTIRLDSPYEQALAKHLARFGETVEAVARELKPHMLCTYLYDLASRFSSFYENCPVLQSDDATKMSRLAICDLTAKVMARGLDLLGIEHPEQM
jgi:arginyl-tRNA synthetase